MSPTQVIPITVLSDLGLPTPDAQNQYRLPKGRSSQSFGDQRRWHIPGARCGTDRLADSMIKTIQRLNAGHKDALVLLPPKLARIQSQGATSIEVGRLGLHVRLKTQDGLLGALIAFL